jgi:hypothetical protein
MRQVTTRNEVDEDAWDSDGTHTHTSAVTGSTVRERRSWAVFFSNLGGFSLMLDERPMTCPDADTDDAYESWPGCGARNGASRVVGAIGRGGPATRLSSHLVLCPAQEASRSSWLDQMQRNEPQPYTATLKQQMKGAGEPGADALQRFAQFAEALDDGLCRLAAVAIAQNAINNVKAALYNSAATAIQAAERGRQARKRFRVALGRSREARLKRLLATAVKLGVLTLLLCILLALWLREGGSQQCVAPAPTCRPRPPPAPAPAPARAPSTAFRVAAPGGAASAAQACRPRP